MDWQGLMDAGLVRLRLTPAVFWSLTPLELQMLLGVRGGKAPLGRGELDVLLAAFPDVKKDLDDG